MKKAHAIHVDWEGCTVGEALKKTSPDDRGLYQIYGAHEVYSKRKNEKPAPVLLYVGRTTGQTFGGRLNQHNKSWLKSERERRRDVDFSIRLGRLRGGFTNNDEWVKCVSDAEKVTIWWCSPAYNSASVARPPNLDSADEVEIRHEGDLGDLRAFCVWPEKEPGTKRRGDEA